MLTPMLLPKARPVKLLNPELVNRLEHSVVSAIPSLSSSKSHPSAIPSPSTSSVSSYPGH